jgi:uncharacterized protein YjbI with pentapeptide repeats
MVVTWDTGIRSKKLRAEALVPLGKLDQIPPSQTDFSKLEGKDLDFSGQDLTGASFRDAKIMSPKFVGTRMQGADLTGSRMTGVSLGTRTFPGAVGRCAILVELQSRSP